jgi:hypothetical protein
LRVSDVRTCKQANGSALFSNEEISAQLSKTIAAMRRVLPEDEPGVSKASGHSKSKNFQPTISASDLRLAFAELTRARKILGDAKRNVSPKITTLVADYLGVLRRFKKNLPQIQGWLLAERARLAGKRSHSAAVESWLRANQQTR